MLQNTGTGQRPATHLHYVGLRHNMQLYKALGGKEIMLFMGTKNVVKNNFKLLFVFK